MFLLPKGKPLTENVPISKVQLSFAMEKLKRAGLTGCALFDFPASVSAVVFENGRLMAAIVHLENREFRDQPAMQMLAEMIPKETNGNFSVYELSKEFTIPLVALLKGQQVISGREISRKLLNSLIEKIRKEQMTATLKLYTDDRCGLVFYYNGHTVGFFHDASKQIETTAHKIRQIAELPKVRADLMVLGDTKTDRCDLNIPSFIRTDIDVSDWLSPPELEKSIIELVGLHTGKLGRALAEKELLRIGGAATLKSSEKLQELLAAIEKGSRLLTSDSRIQEIRNSIASKTEYLI